MSNLSIKATTPAPLPVKTQNTEASNLQTQVKDMKAAQQTSKDKLIINTLKGSGTAALVGGASSLAMAAIFVEGAPSYAEKAYLFFGAGAVKAGTLGAGIGGGVAAAFSDGSKSKGALMGAVSAGVIGGVVVASRGNNLTVTAIGAAAFAVAGAVGGVIGSMYSK